MTTAIKGFETAEAASPAFDELRGLTPSTDAVLLIESAGRFYVERESQASIITTRERVVMKKRGTQGRRRPSAQPPAAAPAPTDTKTWYVCVGELAWGVGESIDEAKRKARSAGAAMKTYYVVRAVQPADKPHPSVNGMGDVEFHPTPDHEFGTPLPVVEARKKGKTVDPASVR